MLTRQRPDQPKRSGLSCTHSGRVPAERSGVGTGRLLFRCGLFWSRLVLGSRFCGGLFGSRLLRRRLGLNGAIGLVIGRSEERRGGKEVVSTCRYWMWQDPLKKK